MGGLPVQRWYVAKTKPRRESAAAVVLSQRDIEAYLPLVSTRWGARARSATYEPLFPGYLFVRLDLGADGWLAARSAPNIGYFLGCDGTPSPIPDDLVEAIRLRADQRTQEPRVIRFRHGDPVVIKHGPFTGIEAVFDGCLSGRGRVRVLLEIVQRYIPVALDVDTLEPVRVSTPPLSVAG